jgi:hypothetical protein
MKRHELETKMKNLGWFLARHGKKHDIWTNKECDYEIAVPRHREINEYTAKAILKDAEGVS